jgi:hypothetical protein
MPSNPTLKSLQKPNTKVNESQTVGRDGLPLIQVCAPPRTSQSSPLPGEQLNQEVAEDQLGLQLSCHQADIRGEAIF